MVSLYSVTETVVDMLKPDDMFFEVCLSTTELFSSGSMDPCPLLKLITLPLFNEVV